MPVNACCCGCDCIDGVWTLSNILLGGSGPTTIPESTCGNSLKLIIGSTGYLCIDSNTTPYWNSLAYIQYQMGGMSDGCGNYVSTYLQSLPADHNPPYANLYDELFATGNVLDRFLAWVWVRNPAYLESYGTPADCDYRGPTFGCAWWLCVKKQDNTYVHAGGLIGWAYVQMRLHNPTKQPNGTCKWDLDFTCSGSPPTGGWWFLTSPLPASAPVTLDCCPGAGETTTITVGAYSANLTATITLAEAGI